MSLVEEKSRVLCVDSMLHFHQTKAASLLAYPSFGASQRAYYLFGDTFNLSFHSSFLIPPLTYFGQIGFDEAYGRFEY